MRRVLSIAIVMLFGFVPLAPLLPTIAESQLPQCCRRHGAHHCMMAPQQAAPAHPLIGNPERCPLYHPYSPVTTGVFALNGAPLAATAPLARVFVAHSNSAALQPARSRSGRGPPLAA